MISARHSGVQISGISGLRHGVDLALAFAAVRLAGDGARLGDGKTLLDTFVAVVGIGVGLLRVVGAVVLLVDV
jgi:hypothetical protein